MQIEGIYRLLFKSNVDLDDVYLLYDIVHI